MIPDENLISESFVLSGGPGGQNVNKVASAVEFRYRAAEDARLTPESLHRLKRLAGSRWTRDGVVLIRAQRFRDQERNRQDARNRLSKLLAEAVKRPKARRATKPSTAAKRKRIDTKKQRGSLKRLRRSSSDGLD